MTESDLTTPVYHPDLASRTWFFFDVGNVLVSDDPSAAHIFEALYKIIRHSAQHRDEPIPHFLDRAVEFVRAGGGVWSFVRQHETLLPDGDFKAFQRQVREHMYQAERWGQVSPEIPGMADAVRKLHSAGKRLGLLCNQPITVRDVLRQRNLLDLFSVHAISDELQLWKPDAALFQAALETAKCRPEDSVMVGDRIDNDVRPAKAFGMATLWLQFTAETRGWHPEDEFNREFRQRADALSHSGAQPSSQADMPDALARTPGDIVTILGL